MAAGAAGVFPRRSERCTLKLGTCHRLSGCSLLVCLRPPAASPRYTYVNQQTIGESSESSTMRYEHLLNGRGRIATQCHL